MRLHLELDLLAEVDRPAVVDPEPERSARIRAAAGETLLDRREVDGVVHVPHEIDVGHPHVPGEPPPRSLGLGHLEPGRHDAATRGRSVDVEVVDPGRTAVGPQVDPHAVYLDTSSSVSRQRHPAAGRDRARPAAPGEQLDLAVRHGRREDVDAHGAHDPEVLGRAPPCLVHVVRGDVLEEARDGVESEPAPGIAVGKADPACRAVRPPLSRRRDERLRLHARER